MSKKSVVLRKVQVILENVLRDANIRNTIATREHLERAIESEIVNSLAKDPEMVKAVMAEFRKRMADKNKFEGLIGHAKFHLKKHRDASDIHALIDRLCGRGSVLSQPASADIALIASSVVARPSSPAKKVQATSEIRSFESCQQHSAQASTWNCETCDFPNLVPPQLLDVFFCMKCGHRNRIDLLSLVDRISIPSSNATTADDVEEECTLPDPRRKRPRYFDDFENLKPCISLQPTPCANVDPVFSTYMCQAKALSEKRHSIGSYIPI